MNPRAVGLPIHNATYDGLLRPNEPVIVDHVPSGRRLVVKLGADGTVRRVRTQQPVYGCMLVVAGLVTGAGSSIGG
jgi:hypothetical protein